MNRIPAPSRRIALLSARWHGDLVGRARDAARAALSAVPSDPPMTLVAHEVPGALELPLAARRLARSGRHDAVIAFALVVDGGIYRHDFVAQAVIDGLMRAQLDADVPVFSCVLTPQAFHEHDVHRRFFAEHLAEKGREVAAACLGMLESLDAIAA